ncbi:nitrite reductase (NADH) small subunit [Paenibacillus phyllosphaerae]|uniref:Nitrite reductase (NADH) small subunit n=1 Tax=Paenibacillus phyllosphaerae TaxID=274593 RepID=A0A7W5AYA4_9BACL|nr:nitrite reductase small subunit NirD [Paenibacillus phyllosphaerae]MBB3110963.1 nitrite reductase (NADH) small subunit [Paenibacillus phyllosphaerae]
MSIQVKSVYHQVGPLTSFPPGVGKEVRIGTHELAVFRMADGGVYALENRTPHRKGGPLAEAIVSGHYIYCPLRDLKIDVRDGRVQEPDTGQAQVYAVKIKDGCVHIEVPA